jgi:uncharacterized protein
MTAGDIEYLPVSMPVECRLAAGRGKSRTIGGYALTFGTLSADLGGFVEQVVPSFCETTRAQNFANVICRYNHDSNLVLGAVSSGTLRCSVDSRGLDYSVDCPEWPGPPYVYDMVQRGDVRFSSFSFRADSDGGDHWEQRDGRTVRTLVSGIIHETAPVAIPAYPSGTSVALRSLARQKDASISDVEQAARDGELRKFLIRTDGGSAPAAPGTRFEVVQIPHGLRASIETDLTVPPAERSVPPEPAPEPVPEPEPEPEYTGRNGKEALAMTRAMQQKDGRSALLETLAMRSYDPIGTRAAEADVPVPTEPEPAPVPLRTAPLTGKEALARTMAMRRKDGRSALLETLAMRSDDPVGPGRQELVETLAQDYPEVRHAGNVGRAIDAYLSES